MNTEFKRRDILAAGLSLPVLVADNSSVSAATAESAAGYESQLRPTVQSPGMHRSTLAQRMAELRVPGVCVAVLRDGEVASIRGNGTRVAETVAPIGPATLFSVGSISKIATAALCLRLVALGRLDLDRDIGRWLRRWRVPPGPAGDTGLVTLRRLLSHTAGFNVHGFADFAPDSALPTLAQILTGAPPASNSPLRRVEPAGSRALYSGGGYMVAQAVLEDAMGDPLDVLARRHLFVPLGMSRSTFSATLSARWGDIAHAHDDAGRPVAAPPGWQSFPELAASGLWTCGRDLALLVAALIGSYRGDRDPFLPREIIEDMMTAVSPGIFGLGPRLAGSGASAIFHHGGANDSYKAYLEGNLAGGQGLVILTNGARGELLGDEIRNAVSDANQWPGDWSVVAQTPPRTEMLERFVGSYSRRPGQARALVGLLDTSFDRERLEIRREEGRLVLVVEDRTRALAPMGNGRFVAPDIYVPAGTLQLEFKRDSDRSIGPLIVTGGGGALLFDRE